MEPELKVKKLREAMEIARWKVCQAEINAELALKELSLILEHLGMIPVPGEDTFPKEAGT